MEQGIDLDFLFMDSVTSMDPSEKSSCLVPEDSGLLAEDSCLFSEDHRAKQIVDNNNNNDVAPSPPSAISETKSTETDSGISQVKTRKVEYNLRTSSLINRVETERRQKAPKQPKPKSRPPPLSKYRRRAANARERGRMLEMNDAFEALAEVVPEFETQESRSKTTKITTLRMALNYIAALRETLGYPPHTSASGFTSSGGSCSSPSEVSSSDTGSEGISSPGRCHLDSEGEQLGQLP